MEDEKWRERLARAVEASGMSDREISAKAGASPGYLHTVLTRGQVPTIDYLLAVIEAIGASAIYIIHDIEMSPNTERLLKLLNRISEEQRQALWRLAETMDPEAD